MFRNHCLWLDANGGCRGSSGLEMVSIYKPTTVAVNLPIELTAPQDFHYRGRRKC